NETYTYSLVSKKHIELLGYDPEKTFKIINPISSDYEYLRPTMFGNLLDSFKVNQANFSKFKIYEFGKRFLGQSVQKAEEEYLIWAALANSDFYQAKGDLELFLDQLGALYKLRPVTKEDNHYWMHPSRTAQIETLRGEYLGVIGEVHPTLIAKWGIKEKVLVWGLSIDLLKKNLNQNNIYQPISKYPGVVEDISLIIPENVLYQDVVDTIKSVSKLVASVELIDIHDNSKLLRVTYLDKNANLTSETVNKVRSTILSELKSKFKVSLKS
ncbi:hypothetical protein HY310_00590, partial [Candidatus Microgenomates bacterium]|nr:hypothetical protein [Candidatus Microgenomates bacterium]